MRRDRRCRETVGDLMLRVRSHVRHRGSSRNCPGFVNGNDLYAYCTASDNSKRGICLGYVEGMADSIGLMQTASAAAVFCIPPVLASQARDVVVKYLQDNPAHRHEAGATLVMEALHDAWPCR